MSLLVTLAYVHSNSLLQAWIGISKFPLAQGVLERENPQGGILKYGLFLLLVNTGK